MIFCKEAAGTKAGRKDLFA